MVIPLRIQAISSGWEDGIPPIMEWVQSVSTCWLIQGRAVEWGCFYHTYFFLRIANARPRLEKQVGPAPTTNDGHEAKLNCLLGGVGMRLSLGNYSFYQFAYRSKWNTILDALLLFKPGSNYYWGSNHCCVREGHMRETVMKGLRPDDPSTCWTTDPTCLGLDFYGSAT
jgi:hypothetical protein